MTTYEKFREMQDNNIMLTFKGEITSEIISMVLQIAETKLDSVGEKSGIKKKIFNILVECLQNLYHHAEPENIHVSEDEINRPALLEIWYDDNYYYILTGNYIRNENIDRLNERISKVNSLSKEDLRRFYREILDNEKISDKGGADLGMIDMARKSGEKLIYSFEKANEDLSFFEMRIRIAKKEDKG